jgi:fused signal recognition particle receptor
MTIPLIILALLVLGIIVYFVTRPSPKLPEGEETEALPTPRPSKQPSKEKPETAEAATRKGEGPSKAESVRPPKAESVRPPAPTAEPGGTAETARKSAPPPAGEPATTEPAALTTTPATEPAATPVEPALTPRPPERLQTPAPSLRQQKKDLSALKKGLSQTRTGWMQKLLAVFTGRKEIDPALMETIEETLLTGDVGTQTTKRLVDALKERLDRSELSDTDKVWDALKSDSRTILDVGAEPFGHKASGKPFVILMVGVNGAGKTTTIAKLAARYKEEGRSVLLAAGDTFRAAAVQQLEMWGKRVGVPVHKGKEGTKPASVVFEAVTQGVQQNIDVVIADTAGRLQTKAPLMEELRKIRDACNKASPGAPHEILLVLDATTGQNAISQAREFRDTLDLTGIVLTKLDGTAKGGVILAVADEFKLPVRFIGVGEKSDDLREFDASDFVDALFARGEETAE